MTPAISKESDCVRETGQIARTGRESSTLDGRRYELNPGFARNSWLQPYVLQES